LSEYVWPAVVALVAVLAFLRLRRPPLGAKKSDVRRLRKEVAALKRKLEKVSGEGLEEQLKPLRDQVDKVTKAFPKEVNAVVQNIANDVMELKGEWTSMNVKANLKKLVDDSKK
jgi:hypothetical protein